MLFLELMFSFISTSNELQLILVQLLQITNKMELDYL